MFKNVPYATSCRILALIEYPSVRMSIAVLFSHLISSIIRLHSTSDQLPDTDTVKCAATLIKSDLI
jgi:hypothetical protein